MEKKEIIIKLNVGGVSFMTTLETLKVSPYFKRLLTYDDQSLCDRLENNEIFIDRDGDLFQHVLEYLRCSDICADNLEELIEEAEFYQLKEMVDSIQYLLQKRAFTERRDYILVDLDYLETVSSLSLTSEDVAIQPLYEKYDLVSVVSYKELQWRCGRHNALLSECQQKDRRDCNHPMQVDGSKEIKKLLVAKKLNNE